MHYTTCFVAAVAASSVAAQEIVLGAYIFSRHGDRNSKSTPPVGLTDLGYQEIYQSGQNFRNRYVASGASRQIYGINTNLVKLSQVVASAPVDNTLQNSAAGFLQGLYPPVGEGLGSQVLANGQNATTPLNGFQLIPLQSLQTGAGSESSAWLQGSTSCANAQISSNNYFFSAPYLAFLNSTQSFYNGVAPMINNTFSAAQTSFKNAYTIFDLLNVASIHNATFPSMQLLTNETYHQLRTLADVHEFGLAYNASEPIRAVTGSIIANDVVVALNQTINNKGATKLNIQFGAYAGMLSFFGLSNLTAASPDFHGVPDYAASLTWELVTNATVSNTSFPSSSDISVRFYFNNGTSAPSSALTEFPLFGTSVTPLPWSQFTAAMNKFSIKSQADWCNACGNSTGVCSAGALGQTDSNSSSGSASSSSESSHKGGMSLAVAGVIGAMVTLAVILGIELLIVLIGGLRVVSKKRLNGTSPVSSITEAPKA